jgi:hypothetical protein
MAKHLLNFVLAIGSFVLVVWLLRNHLPLPVTWGIGSLVMLLVGYPVQRALSPDSLSFSRWAIASAAGALVGIAASYFIMRIF